jgi:RNA polymerase sigma-70 factor (ECF subfamily)
MAMKSIGKNQNTSSEEAEAISVGRSRPATLDEDAMTQMYRLHSSHLLRSLVRVTSGDLGKAQDILQETMLRAWKHPEAFPNGPEHARGWLWTVARRVAIDHFRMQASRAKEVADELPENRAVVGDPYDEVLVARDIGVALDRLPAHHRQVLVELHVNGRSLADVAEALGVPTGTVKSRNFYAIRALRPVLKECGIAS